MLLPHQRVLRFQRKEEEDYIVYIRERVKKIYAFLKNLGHEGLAKLMEIAKQRDTISAGGGI